MTYSLIQFFIAAQLSVKKDLGYKQLQVDRFRIHSILLLKTDPQNCSHSLIYNHKCIIISKIYNNFINLYIKLSRRSYLKATRNFTIVFFLIFTIFTKIYFAPFECQNLHEFLILIYLFILYEYFNILNICAMKAIFSLF